MRIEEIELVPYALPFRKPYVTARGRLDRREMVLVRLRTDAGLEGLGEAVPLALRGGDDLVKVERRLRRACRRLSRADVSDFEGQEPLRAAIDAFVHAAAGRRLPPPAAAAIETALLDLAGKAAGVPVWRLLGAERSSPVLCNATLAAGEPGEVAAAAQRWASRGFGSFKLKLGVGDDLRQVSAVREAVGPEARIRVDANGSWSRDDAIAILGELEPLDVELAEQPTEGLRDMAGVAAATSIPIAADESVATGKQAARAARARACKLATVKLAKSGGVGGAAGIAKHLPVYLSSALDGPIGIAAAAHAGQAIYRDSRDPGLAHGLATQALFADSVATRECELRDGELHVPDAPGLGVEIDDSALAGLRI
ncbi:MAG TPA: mandelate racemase/muconate lactonizing enzyme family protein [Solirubrobacterales bacterium]|nr:mandelate racemase/muconate lactonizing enzyme family protein [Solirubrobacterales bacterium]